MKIRLATTEDLQDVLAIYAYYVTNTTATFAYAVPTQEEYGELFQKVSRQYPFLVCEIDGAIAGFAYAHRYKEKEAYQWNVEITMYIDVLYQRQHIGSTLMETLLSILKYQNVRNVYSCITIPNEASIALHRSFEFEEIAHFTSTGYKQGQWLDVVWLQKQLNAQETPAPIKDILACEDNIHLYLHNKNRFI